MTTPQIAGSRYVARCETCGVSAELASGMPVAELEMMVFLAAHMDCKQFSITLNSAPAAAV